VAGVALENSWLPLAEEALSFVADEIHRASNT
jgi:hypothetical protein